MEDEIQALMDANDFTNARAKAAEALAADPGDYFFNKLMGTALMGCSDLEKDQAQRIVLRK